jgi:hypothetical protein
MMIPGLLAGAGTVNAENALHALIPLGSNVAQVVIYCGALFVVPLAVFAWAVFFRRQRPRRRPSHHHRSKPASRHHRQPEILPRQRTLAEAGGLPPIRSQQQPPSPA